MIEDLMLRFNEGKPDASLPNGGATIGLLERSFTFLLVISGYAMAVIFLLAAKSLLRFSTVAKQQKSSEYLIIGTLVSFGWAFLVAEITVMCLLVILPA